MDSKFPPTAQQQAFLDALVDPNGGHLALVARAGCGKTSTILMGVGSIRERFPRAETLVCAFNKSIADEVSEKLREAGHGDWRTVQASTLHSLGWGLLKFALRLDRNSIDDKKTQKLVDAQNHDDFREFRNQIIDLVGYAKGEGFGFFPDRAIENAQAWHDIADHYDINGLDDTSEAEIVVARAQEIYRAGLRRLDVVDFDDMILIPLIRNITTKFTKDFVFLDEAQDLSRTRQALARRFLRPGTGRMVVVGDDRQAIYGFSGADAAALPNLISSLGAKVLPLSVTWRCPRDVVRVAQHWVPDIEAAPSAPDGLVRDMGPELRDGRIVSAGDLLAAEVGPDDAVLCRNVAPLVEMAYKIIRSGKPAKVEGRAIGDGLVALAQRWKITSVSALTARLEVFLEKEVQKALSKGNEQKAEEVQDRVGTLVEICKAVQERGLQTVSDVVQYIRDLFADGAADCVVLASYHRSKGREWPRVYLLEHSKRCPSRAARQKWQLEQEDNLAYVAVTRAQRELVWVEG